MATTDPNFPDFDDFQRYTDGTMPSEEQHRLEKLMLDDPFAAEAFEGYLLWRDENAEAIAPNADLRRKLAVRTARRKAIVPLWAYGAAASAMVAVAFLGYYFVNVGPKERNTATERVATGEVANVPAVTSKKVEAGMMLKNTETAVMRAQSQSPALPARAAQGQELVARDIALKDTVHADESAVAIPDTTMELAQSQPAPASSAPGAPLPAQAFAKSLSAQTKTVVPSLPQVSGRVVDAKGEAEQSIPRPVSGWQKYRAYLDSATHSAQTEGKVTVSFVVNADGTLSDFFASGSDPLKDEAIRIVRAGPAWALVLHKGQAVSTTVELDLQFRKSQ